MQELLKKASGLGYYVLLDCPEILSAAAAEQYAAALFVKEGPYCFDGLIITAFLGSDTIRPFLNRSKDCGKDVFVLLRSANKSASELQDLLTGGRHVFEAKTDVVNRYKNTVATKSGYDRIAVVGPASSGSILRKLREKYKNLFILVDGYDLPSANAKNCAEAVDRYGHGAAVCAGSAIACAWQAVEAPGAWKPLLTISNLPPRQFGRRWRWRCRRGHRWK